MKTKPFAALSLFALPALLLGVALPLAACAPAATPALTGDLTVFAAASLTDAFTELGTQFEAAHPGSAVTFNFAGSNSLAQQIGQAAPADVFASANGAQMLVAIDTGRIVSGTQQTFVRNRLVVIVPTDNPGGVTALPDLGKPGLTVVLAAAEVPVGQYSLDFLDKAAADAAFAPGFKDAVLANVVSYEDNVRAVLTKVALGEADAGIVYSSDVTGESAGAVTKLDIPDALNTVASYPIAALSDSPHAALAQAFVDFVLSAAGQAVLTRYGFIAVK